MSLQACPFLDSYGHKVLGILEEYQPFSSEEHKAFRAHDHGYTYGSVSAFRAVADVIVSAISAYSNASRPIDNSVNLFSSRPVTHVTINIDGVPLDKQAEKAKEEREKKELAERRNQQILVASGLGAGLGGVLFGSFYRQYVDARDKLAELKEKGESVLEQVPNESGINSSSDLAVKETIRSIFKSYNQFHSNRIWKLKSYAVLAGSLFAELTVVCISAFYKSFRLRDAMGVAFFVTALAGIVFHFSYGNIDSQARWDKHKSQVETIDKIRNIVNQSRPLPPSYAQFQEARLFQQAGFTIPKVGANGQVETQNMHKGEWFWFHFAEQRWIPYERVGNLV